MVVLNMIISNPTMYSAVLIGDRLMRRWPGLPTAVWLMGDRTVTGSLGLGERGGTDLASSQPFGSISSMLRSSGALSADR
ncbi:MAG: hypothetical protein U1F70_03400 [Candidatus Competibacteraceae bacterium]